MEYCPPNITLNVIWIDHGFSKCFIETATTGSIAIFITLFGMIQLYIYKKYATANSQRNLESSVWYFIQQYLHFFMPILAIVKFILQATVLADHQIHGYMILSLCLTVWMYLIAYILLTTERHYLLPSVPSRGHGLILLTFWSLNLVCENLSFVNLGEKAWWFKMVTLSDQIEMTNFVMRYTSCFLLFILGLKAPGVPYNNDYYGLNDSSSINMPPAEPANQGSTFRNGWQKLRTLAPFMWPKKDVFLQMRVIVCFMLLIAGRVINLFVPIYSMKIIDSMTAQNPEFRWDLIVIYVAFKFFQGSGAGTAGVLNNLRNYLWISIQQYTSREIEVELFRHLHSLSLRWHLNRKTGEVHRVINRGTDSLNSLLSTLLFSILPTLVDIIVAVVYFLSVFNIWFGIIVFTTMLLYIIATVMVTEWRTKFHRQMNLADNAVKARALDSLLNYETVKYYGAEDYEVKLYREAILTYQKEEWKAMLSLNILNTLQNVIISIGLLAGSLLCLYKVVVEKTFTVGEYVLFSSYIIQLYMPLNFFGTYYRATQRNFIDMENMFDLMKEHQDVIDPPNAPKLIVKKGQVEFRNVSFGYSPQRTILQNINFTIDAGTTVALVGPSGAGKSTIIRLLFRFYDLETGAIFVDGQNLKTVRQDSLRRIIGVVPQDTVLFNNTIKYNINYGNVDAPEADVIKAAVNADLHDRILTFPQGYETQVGERGLRLSGGEKQRVAIARTMLKAPNIILLDEATSALDTQTERHIQAALMKICANRTTLIVAHRLSTIVHADEIIVLDEGRIVERGKHSELIDVANGVYAGMWQNQLEGAEKQEEPDTAKEEAGDVTNINAE